ncbi:MAG: hypothetical protein Q8M84_05275 [Thiobacillus sp.]|nr:hypothetical protein [Thiobacillus sp.]
MSLVEELRSLLPTRVAKWTLALTALLLPLAIKSPLFLKPLLWPTASEKDIVLYQILVTTLLLLVGLFVTIISIWHHYAFGRGRRKKQIGKQIIEVIKNRGV